MFQIIVNSILQKHNLIRHKSGVGYILRLQSKNICLSSWFQKSGNAIQALVSFLFFVDEYINDYCYQVCLNHNTSEN